jgi:AraC-like DNA-binding protein/quercetin dioxygenase-like cupin family protein
MARMRVLLSEIDPARVSVGEVVYPPGGRLGPRRQDDTQLVLVHTGSARIAIDDASPATHRAGTVALLLPGHREHFAFDDDAPTRHSWVQAHGVGVPEGLPAALPLSTTLAELVRATVEAARTPLSTARPLVAALAAAALLRYAGEAESGAGGPGGAVDLARAFMHAHVADPDVGLAEVAAAAHVSPPHLVRRFRAELGITPIAYLWQRRVATGVDLLKHTGLPVGDVAARSGFKSVYHFSRRVSEVTGRSPTRLRRERWDGTAAG